MHQITIFNHTNDSFSITHYGLTRLHLDSSSQVACMLPQGKRVGKMIFESTNVDSEKASTLFYLNLGYWSYYTRLGWKLINVTGAEYTIFRLALHKKQHAFIIFPKRSLTSFLKDMPSSLPLSSLMLPGTHNSVSFYGWPISQCQESSTPLNVQFASGIRVIDVRLSIINGALISYHGIFPQKLPFLTIIEQVHLFLTSEEGKSETIVMSIKQEDKASLLFSQLVHDGVYNGPGGREMWFLENRIPTLGEVRGKIVMLSRFGGNGEGWENGLEGLGIHPTSWPDSKEEGFEWWLKGTQVKTHDWYSIPSFLSIPEKSEKASRIFLQPVPSPSYPILSFSFLSAASALASPYIVACGFGWPSLYLGVEGVNSRVGKWILSCLSTSTSANPLVEDVHDEKATSPCLNMKETETRLRGWCMMDFYLHPAELGLVSLLVECNYRGRQAGEEGWPT